MIRTRIATKEDHDAIVAIARTTKYTNAYGNIMFSSPDHYSKGWIYVACIDGVILGFACVRHKVRQPETNVYFVGVEEKRRSQGIGAALLRIIALNSPHEEIVLKVARDNPRALSFYERHGFEQAGLDEDYWHMHVRRDQLLRGDE